MSQADEGWLAGVDGCRAGWVTAFLHLADGMVRVRTVPCFADVLAAPEAPGVIAVDIPIGLPERVGPCGRAAENAVRPLLGTRQSSVFSVSARGALVSRFRSSQILAAPSDANFGIKGTLATL
jgi:predicted RNase H-like nuclease